MHKNMFNVKVNVKMGRTITNGNLKIPDFKFFNFFLKHLNYFKMDITLNTGCQTYILYKKTD